MFEPSPKAKKAFASKVQELEIEYSVRLSPEDEEWKTINWDERDHLKLLPQIEAGLKAKAGKGQSEINHPFRRHTRFRSYQGHP